MTVQTVAIIGAGITGLGAAWLLHPRYRVTLFEKNTYLGGHTHTITVREGDNLIPVDTGFIVYNERNYPNLVGLFRELQTPTRPTDMSFAFSLDQGELEYAGSNLNTLFAQRRNLWRPRYWHFLAEILRFNLRAYRSLSQPASLQDLSLGDFLALHRFSKALRDHYLLPMGAAIWSCPAQTMLQFPALSFLRFCANHGLLDLWNRPRWRTVCGGSSFYVQQMRERMGQRLGIKPAALRVERHPSHVTVHTAEESIPFDAVIFACHADQALALLADPTLQEETVLGSFRYQPNHTYLHTDASLMPRNRRVWSSWNYLTSSDPTAQQRMTATYWMNNLQGLTCGRDYFVTLNPYRLPREDSIIAEMVYEHPVFDQAAVAAQALLPTLQGQQRSWFCGSYARYGFHEDALWSAVTVCRDFGVIPSWQEDAMPVPNRVQPLAAAGVITS